MRSGAAGPASDAGGAAAGGRTARVAWSVRAAVRGRVDWRAPGQPVDGASSVRLAPVREEGDDSGDEDDLPAEYLERLSKDLGRLVVQEGRSLDSF